MRENFNLFGFKINTKNFLITMAVSAGALLLLLLLDALWLDISWYGVLIGTGFLLAIAVACGNAPLRGFDSSFVYSLVWWIFPLSIIGARVYYVIFDWNSFDTFWDMCKIWEGGMAIYGGIIGGVIGLIICCLIKKKSILDAMDLAAPSLILGQAIGRWGNFINVEVYGFEVTNKALQWFPFAVKVGSTYHLATFFYESILNIGGFFLLLYILRKCKDKGIVTSTYFLFYGIVRICLESLRIPEYILFLWGTNIPVSSLVSACLILAGAVWLTIILIKKYKHNKKLKRADELIEESLALTVESGEVAILPEREESQTAKKAKPAKKVGKADKLEQNEIPNKEVKSVKKRGTAGKSKETSKNDK